ncbi:MAG: hypothetical protein JNL83_21970 [Myxococcales bacterium]|nr:hypothetical protein [Myxococcales bacterium]
MSRPDRQLLVITGIAALIAAVFWLLWIVSDSAGSLVFALVVHAAVAIATAVFVEPRRRGLAAALGLAVPVFGPIAAAAAAIAIGTDSADLLHDPHVPPSRIDGAEIARRLNHSLPVCEALASGDVTARRLAITKLKARGSAEDIAILRWAHAQARGDAAVELALALEEVSARFETQIRSARAAAAAEPSYATLSAAFLLIAGGVASGAVDAQLAQRIAAEGAKHHEAAVALDPQRGKELLVARVRLELAMHRPAAALDLIGDPVPPADTELGTLYREAAYAARCFELVPELSRGRG